MPILKLRTKDKYINHNGGRIKNVNFQKLELKYNLAPKLNRPSRAKKKEKKLVPLEWIIEYKASESLSIEEKEIINSMEGVTWKPRQNVVGGHYNRDLLKFEIYGLNSEYELGQWLIFNRLENSAYFNELSDYFQGGGNND